MNRSSAASFAVLLRAVENVEPVSQILIGMHDYGAGLDLESFRVTADFAIDGVPAGENLAGKFRRLPESRWSLSLKTPLAKLPTGKLTVSVQDRQGNVARIERTFAEK